MYKIMIGASSKDIRLSGSIKKEGTTKEFPYHREEIPDYYNGKIQMVGDRQFEIILGHSIPDGSWSGELGLNDAICQMYYAKSALARYIYRFLDYKKKKSEEKGKPDLNILFIYNMPFRGIAKMTGGIVSMEMAEGMVEVVNGHLLKGLGKVVGGYFRNRSANKKYEKILEGKE